LLTGGTGHEERDHSDHSQNYCLKNQPICWTCHLQIPSFV